MAIPKDVYQNITRKHGAVLDLKNNPGILEEILHELRSIEQDDFSNFQKQTASPFKVSWMDSWAANWIINQSAPANAPEKEFNTVMRQLVDLKFRERLNEIRRFIRGRMSDAPDGGPPEPGTPPAGPQGFGVPTPPPDPWHLSPPPPPEPGDPDASIFAPPPPDPNDPDASIFSPPPPDPGFVFNEPPDGGPPEPGVPDPPNPGPTGPDAGVLRDNPWILYWFVSINTPLILEMIDAHFTRRLNDLRTQMRGK